MSRRPPRPTRATRCCCRNCRLDLSRRITEPELRVALWLEVEPARLSDVGAALAVHAEVAFAGATTGTSHVYAAISCKDAGALYRCPTGPVSSLPGIRRTETAPIHRTLKGASPLMEPGRGRPAESDRH